MSRYRKLPPSVKPPLGWVLDRTSPFSPPKGGDLLLFNEAAGMAARNLANPSFPAAANFPATWVPGGVAVSGSISFEIPSHVNYAAGDFSIRVIHRPRAWSADYTALFDKGGASSTRELSLFFDTLGNVLYYGIGTFSAAASVPTAMTPGREWDFWLIRQGTICSCYVNGLLKGTFTPTFATTASAFPLCLGRNSTSGGLHYDGTYLKFEAWPGVALTAAQVMSKYIDRYGEMAPPSSRSLFAPSAATVSSLLLARRRRMAL